MHHNANVSKPFPIWVVFRNNPRWEPPANKRWSKAAMCWARAEAELAAQEVRAFGMRAAIVRVEVPLPKEKL